MGLKGALHQREKKSTKVQKNYFEELLFVYETEDSKQIGMEESEQRLGLQDTKQHCTFKWTINHPFGIK